MRMMYGPGTTKGGDFTGADIIVRKALPFMARQVPPIGIVPQRAHNELCCLAHDDIGACREYLPLLYQI
jgi:hypothetical protein